MPKKDASWFQGKKWSWLRYLLHLETLFVIGVVGIILYFIFFRSPTKNHNISIQDFINYARNNNFENNNYASASHFHPGSGVGIENTPLSPDACANLPPIAPKRKCNKKCETRCREIFSKVFAKEFPTVRPSWLKNPVTGRALELDGFCKDVTTSLGQGLAFEYDGGQHSKYTPYYQSCPEEFAYQIKKDEFKNILCRENGILLVRIPSFVAYDDLQRWLLEKLKRLGFGREVSVYEKKHRL